MKLLVYDKFWNSFIDLPKSTQKKVVEFQKKFRENSKSSGIHLEPISTFKDKSLRSARVDKTYRAIIKSPESGDVYYLLWVDHHDEAYKWATNKMFQWNDVTQSMQMFAAPEVAFVPEAKEEPQMVQKAFFNMIDTEKLIKIGVPEVLLPSIQTIDTFSDLEGVEDYIPSDVFEYLFYLLEGAKIDDLIHEINAGRVDDKDLDKQVESINNQRSFIELTDDSLFNEALSGCLNKWKHYLHPSQRKLVNGDFKGSVKVSGGAGTGKTVAALHRLKFLSETKQANEKIVFTTYTRALTENLSNLITGLSIDTKDVAIMNIDQVVLGLIKDYKLFPVEYKVFEYHSVKKSIDLWEEIVEEELTSYSPEFLEAEYKQIVLNNALSSFDEYVRIPRKGRGKPVSRRQRKEIWGYVEKFKSLSESKKLYYRDELFNTLTRHLNNEEKKSFDYCLVDELQDFSNVELRLVRSLVPEKANDLFMVGDPMQSIYSKRINFSQAGINIRGKKSHRLRINYRTTEEIKKLAVSVIQDCHYDNFEGEEEEKAGYVSLFHGSKPTYTVHKTKDTEVSSVFDAITNLIENGYQYSDVAVCARTKSGLKEFRNALHKQKVPYDDNDSDKFSTSNAVSLLTFHKIKGLEFKHVFIVDVNDRTVPKLPFDFDDYEKEAKSNYLRNEKSMVYVAVSRAIENVTITGTGRKSEFLKV
ncbi:putative DNA helicase [Lentisphaera araneosa HTCC2155]|uniref:DNA 3'-5' helicase n=1 Tax=Lentisphaera araneosa HTCC2155 TaxID=313628 RepID=A6DRE0_9BACT|nr:3'-5' exonuclease [Lentisphaera araneosa]EDM25750.1 putative DNA helicase [Lentisphaera araneosa HTCC2155]